jgi:hypothetical protein
VEPDYVEVAFKNDSKEAFKDSDYNKYVEQISKFISFFGKQT